MEELINVYIYIYQFFCLVQFFRITSAASSVLSSCKKMEYHYYYKYRVLENKVAVTIT